MTPTRPRTLLAVLAVAAAVTWILLSPLYTHLPPLPWTDVPALIIAAVAEALAGRDIRNRVLGRRGAKPAPPIFVARMAVIAKASSQVAALLAGVACGFIFYLSGLVNDSIPRRDLVTASVGLVASLLLMAAALYLEWCCRVPRHPSRDPTPDPAPNSSNFPSHH
jgi:hypothetical protein